MRWTTAERFVLGTKTFDRHTIAYLHVKAFVIFVYTYRYIYICGVHIMPKTATLTIQQWGNSLAVRTLATVARSAHFEVGQKVEVTTEEIDVSVKPVGARKFTLAEKLAQFDPAKHGGEAMKTPLEACLR